MAGNSSCSVIGNSYQGVANLVQFPRREIESVVSEPTLSYSPLWVKPFRQLSSFVFHLVFLCAERSRQSIWIALEKQGECHFAEQTGRTKPQDGTINRTQSDVVVRRHLFHQPTALIVRPLRIDSERGHSRASFLLIGLSLNKNPLTLKYIMILRGYDFGRRAVSPMLGKRP